MLRDAARDARRLLRPLPAETLALARALVRVDTVAIPPAAKNSSSGVEYFAVLTSGSGLIGPPRGRPRRGRQRGRTGYPIVDAGMRELWHTGVMHNRVRMIAASFLIKNLLIDWRRGEEWFWDTLVDADLANTALLPPDLRD